MDAARVGKLAGLLGIDAGDIIGRVKRLDGSAGDRRERLAPSARGFSAFSAVFTASLYRCRSVVGSRESLDQEVISSQLTCGARASARASHANGARRRSGAREQVGSPTGEAARLMDDFAIHDVVVRPFEVRQFETPQLADRRVERLTARFASRGAPLPPQCPQRPQHLSAVEPLPLTVLTKAHGTNDDTSRLRAARRRVVLGSKEWADGLRSDMSTHGSVFGAMLQEFDGAARLLNLEPGIWKILTHPKRQITVSCPVQMDNGEIEVFTGYRVQYNITLGPAKAASAITRASRSTK